MFTKAFSLAVLLTALAPAFCAEWMTDFTAAKARAKAEKKAILADFTGSDWCSACKHLRAKVLNSAEFDTYADKRFVLLEVDVPMHPTFSEEQLKKNKQLVRQYRIEGFPTLLVLTADGSVAGGFVGARDSFEQVKPLLKEGLVHVGLLNKAAKTKDAAAKVDLLVRVYRNLGPDVRPCAAELRNTILAQNTEGQPALAQEREAEAQLQELRRRSENLYGMTPQQMQQLVAEYEGKVYPENLLPFLQIKMTALLFAAESVQDLERAQATLLKDAEALKHDRQQTEEQIRHQFADPATLLQRMQEFKKEQAAAPKN